MKKVSKTTQKDVELELFLDFVRALVGLESGGGEGEKQGKEGVGGGGELLKTSLDLGNSFQKSL